MGCIAVLHALISNRALIRLRLKRKGKLLDWLQVEYEQYFDEDQFLVEKWMGE
jgi:hypothetical protein